MKRKKMSLKNNMQQPPSSYADYTTELTDDEDVGKDFGSLINAPLSKGGYFVFKSEKDWSPVDFSEYSEFFTLNLNTLSHALDSIPFNEYVDIDDRYFTSDQLTSICNKADESKAVYNCILNIAKTSSSSNTVLMENETNEDTSTEQLESLEYVRFPLKDDLDNLEDDVDFLLSLDEPVQKNLPKIIHTFSIPTTSTCANNDSKPKSKNVPAKPLDLEKWLDSVLDD